MLAGRTYTPADIWEIVLRGKWLILVPFVLVAAGTVVYSRTLQDRYQSLSVIQVVPPRVSASFGFSAASGRLDDRLPAISQQILSRTRLERIIQDFGLYTQERKKGLMEDIVAGMRADIAINVVKGDAFRVQYISDDPKTAMKVTERLASLFVEENLRDREVLAEGANQFLDSQLDDARRRLLEHEKKLEEYRRQYSGELPSQVGGNLQGIAAAQNQIQAIGDSINRDKDRKLVVERQLADFNAELALLSATPPSAPGRGSPTDPDGLSGATAAERLESAKGALQQMGLRLKPEHPDVLRMKRVIRDLEKRAEAEAEQAPLSEAKVLTPADLMRSNRLRDMKLEIEALDKQIAAKEESQKRVEARIPELERRVDAGPTRESELIALNRDYETLQGIYTSLLRKSEDAKVSANLERRQIGEQFKVIDPARLPERPFWPDRTKINAMGAAAGLALGIGLVVLLEFKDAAFRTEDDIVAVLALPVLATIPAIITMAETRLAKRRRWMIAGASAAMVVLAAAVVLAWKYRVHDWLR